MTTAHARAVPCVFSAVRGAFLATASAGLLMALTPGASAAPSCTGTGNSDTCIITLANIAVESVDAGAQADAPNRDLIQFNDAGLALNANTFGSAIASPVRFANFEAAQVTSIADLTLTGAVSATSPTQSLTWTIDAGGKLFARGGDAIGNLSAVTVNGLLEVGGGLAPADETIGTLSGSGAISILNSKTLAANGSGALVAGDIVGTTFSGVISGNGNFTKVGGGMLKLTGANTFTGTLTVGGGTLEIGNSNAISSASAVNITGGELTAKGIGTYAINAPVTITSGRLTGEAIITGNVSSNGGIQPGNTSVPTFPAGSLIGNPGQDMGTVRINGNYTSTGAGAYLGSFISIDAAAAGGAPGTTHDFLNIVGSASGTTKFSVASFLAAPVGTATTGNGIQVVRITGASASDNFVQGNGLVAGPYQYLLRYVPNYNVGGDDGFFLQSATRDELIAQPALLSASQSLIRNCFRDDQRIPDSPKGATYGRAWFGYRQGNSTFGADTGIDMNEDFSCDLGGMDWRMGSGWFGGVSGGFGTIDASLTTPAGVGKIGGDARVIEAYAAFTSSNFFLNLSGGYANTSWSYSGHFTGPIQADTGGFIGQAQMGIGLGLEPIAVKLFGALNYDGVNCGDRCLGLAGVTESTGLVEARGTVRLDGVSWGGSVRPWASASYSTVISDGINTVSLNGVSVSADTNDALLMIDAGLQTYLDENLSLYADGGYHESLNNDITGYRAGIGLKLYW